MECRGRLHTLLTVLGLEYIKEKNDLAAEVEALIEKRQQARKDKDFALADQIRTQFLGMGIILEDTRQGVKWSKV